MNVNKLTVLATILSSWTGYSVEDQIEVLELGNRQIIECGAPSDNVVNSLREIGYETYLADCDELEMWIVKRIGCDDTAWLHM